MSVRSALIGGMLILAGVATLVVELVAVIGIKRSLVREAQCRVNRDLDTVASQGCDWRGATSLADAVLSRTAL